MTPFDIQIIVPYHFPLECRKDSVEKFLQKLWADAVKRKTKGQSILDMQNQEQPKPATSKIRASWTENTGLDEGGVPPEPAPAPQQDKKSEDSASIKEKIDVQPEIPKTFTFTNIIQKHERYRRWLMSDIKSKAAQRRLYFLETAQQAPDELKHRAANIIQKVHRLYMKEKREKVKQVKRDTILGLIPDAFKTGLSYIEENNKIYERRKMTRLKINTTYLKELEKENTRILMFKKGNQIDDITDEIRNWFKEWFYGYGFFPEFPYEVEGGTILVVRGDYPTIEEKQEMDEKTLKETKGKTKEQMKEERARLKEENKMKAKMAKEAKRKEDENLVKARCNPFSDPGLS
ncbi:IQ and AAA domain-containing protein 1-like [Spodoptera litura]|uniref:IQ and AAA domain-containing protein 1-like n=1 Tax=Spodoptera litura TaxID=69820 RepID=A0A9J7E4K1_SPOLT|nr:IQ and AAA domain-containing protein 1-like [Spodoptera litura]